MPLKKDGGGGSSSSTDIDYTSWYTSELRKYYRKKKKTGDASGEAATEALYDWSTDIYKAVRTPEYQDAVDAYERMMNTPDEDQIEASSWYDTEVYGEIDPVFAEAAPETAALVAYAPVSPDGRSTWAMSQAYAYLAKYHGEENIARYLQLMMNNNDPEMRKLAIGTLDTLTNTSYAPVTRAGLQETQAVSDDTLARVMEDPNVMLSLNPNQRNWIINFAKSINDAGVLSTEGVSELQEELMKVGASIASRNFTQEIQSPQLQEDMKKVLEFAQTQTESAQNFGRGAIPDQDATLAAAYDRLGIVEIRRTGTAEPTVVFSNEEGLDPVKRSVIEAFMADHFPEMRSQYGEGGPIADLFYAWDRTIDGVSSVITPITGTAAGLVTETWEAATGPDRQVAAKQAAEIQRQLDSGEVAIEDRADLTREMLHLQDKAGFELKNPLDIMAETADPADAGFGFADSMLDNAGILPGDAAYDAARGTLYMFSQIAFDPVNYIVPAWGAARAVAKGGAKHVADSVVRGFWKEGDALADAARISLKAEEAASEVIVGVARRGGKLRIGEETLSAAQLAARSKDIVGDVPGGIVRELSTKRSVILNLDDVTSPSPFKIKELTDMLEATGRQYKVLNGGKALWVGNMPTGEGLAWANRLHLRTIRNGDGLIDVATRRIQHNTKIGLANKGATLDGATYSFKAGKDTVTFGFEVAAESKPLKTTGIGRGYVRNAVFKALAPDANDFVANPMIDDAVKVVMANKHSAEVGGVFAKFSARMQELGIGDSRLLEMLWSAPDETYTRLVFQSAMLGRVSDLPDVAKTLNNVLSAEKQLKSLPKQISTLKGQQTKLRTLVAEASEMADDGLKWFKNMTKEFSNPNSVQHSLIARRVASGELERKGAKLWKAQDADSITYYIFDEKTGLSSGFARYTPFNDNVSIITSAGASPGEGIKLMNAVASELDVSTFSKMSAFIKAQSVTDEGRKLLDAWVRRYTNTPIFEAKKLSENLYADKKFYESVLKGTTSTEPLRNIPKGFVPSNIARARKTRYVKAAKGETWVEDLMGGAVDYSLALPAWAIANLEPSAISKLLDADNRISAGFRKMVNAWKPMGANVDVTMPWQTIAHADSGRFAASQTEGMKNVRDYMRQFDVPKRDIDQVVGQMLEAKTESLGEAAWRNMYDVIATRGRRVLPRDIEEIRKATLNTTIEGSTPSRLADGKPTAYAMRKIAGTDVEAVHPLPTWTSQKRQRYTTHSPKDIKRYTTVMGRVADKGPKALKLPWAAVQGIMEGTAQFWKTAVLVGKMPFSLISRIMGEEQLRIMAFGYGSAFNHPVEWFRGVRNADELDLFLRSPEYGVGIIERDFLNEYGRSIKSARLVSRGDNAEVYSHAMAGHINSLHAAPETRLFLPTKGKYKSPKVILAELEKKADSGVGWARSQIDMLNEAADGPLGQIKRMQDEIKAVVGENPEVIRAIKTGKVRGADLTDSKASLELSKMLGEGTWKPTLAEVRHNDFIGGVISNSRKVRDNLFQWFYSRPDLRGSRNPLFMQLAKSDYERLTAMGWKHEKALDAAKYHAAQQVQNMLFKVGGSTSAHYFMRNISPFMPAWQELLETYAYKVPKALGGGSVVAGYARMGRVFHAFRNGLEETGLLKQDPLSGSYYLDLPGDKRIYVGQVAGLIPFPTTSPSEGLGAMVTDIGPGVGALPQALIAELAKRHDGIFDTISDFTLLLGPDRTGLGPSAIAAAYEAVFNEPAFWEFTTNSTRQRELDDAMWDAQRLYMLDNPPPKQEDFKDAAKYDQAMTNWVADVIEAGEEGQENVYALRAITGTFSPYIIYEDRKPEQLQLQALKQLIDTANNGGQGDARFDDYQEIIIGNWLEEHPDLQGYLVSNKFNLDDTNYNGNDDKEFQKWANEHLGTVPPDELPYWYAWKMETISHRREVAKLEAQLGPTIGSYLANSGIRDKIAALRYEHSRWIEWFEVTDQAGAVTDLARLSQEQFLPEQQAALDKLQELKNKNNEIYYKDGRKTEAYYAEIGPVYEVIETINWADPKTQLGKDLERYFQHSSEYYDERNAIWDRIDETDAPLRGPLFDELRQLAARYKPLTIRGETLPTPEEYAFWNRSSIEQQDAKIDWASTPVEWLTPFQREQVGIHAPKNFDKFANWKSRKEQEFREKYDTDTTLWSSSSERVDARAALDREIEQRAKKMGVDHIYAINDQGTYNRIQEVLGFRNEAWLAALDIVDDVRDKITRKGYRVDTDNTATREEWPGLISMFAAWETNDPEFREIMEQVGIALAPRGQDRLIGASLYLKVFFDYWEDQAPYWASSVIGGGY